jgi:hypothetical protein
MTSPNTKSRYASEMLQLSELVSRLFDFDNSESILACELQLPTGVPT